MNLRILAILTILIFGKATATFPGFCQTQIAPLPLLEKKTGKKQPSSFGDPTLMESLGKEQSEVEIETFSLLTPQEYISAVNEINLLLLLGQIATPPIPPVVSCTILEDSSGLKHTFLITRPRLSFNLKTDILNKNLRTKSLPLRARLYSAFAQLVSKIHEQNIAHCNLKPHSFVSDSIKFGQMKLNKYRYMVDATKASCAGNSKSYKPWDVKNQECATTANILKTDSYNLALIILLIEDEKNTSSYDTLIKSSDNPAFKCFFRSIFENDCETTIKNYIKKVVSRKAQKEPDAKPLYRRLASILYRSFVGCKERASSAEIYNELIEISFGKASTPVPNNGQVLQRHFTVNMEENYEAEIEAKANKVLFKTTKPPMRPFTEVLIRKHII